MRSKAKWMCWSVVAVLLFGSSISMAALFDDHFNSSTPGDPLDTSKWKDVGFYYQDGSTYATREGNAYGVAESILTFGPLDAPTIVVEFTGVRIGQQRTTSDNIWGLWDDPTPWSGVAFRFDKLDTNTENVKLMVGTARYVTALHMNVNTLYDFKIEWTPGTEVKFYGNLAGASWDLLRQQTSNVPSDALPIRLRDESINMDFDRITVVPEPATMAMLALGGIGMLVRRRQRA